jgi:hypothetical protein
LKAALKRITYKGLQGGRIDKAEKIYASFDTEIKTLETWFSKRVSTYNILADDVEEVLFMREFDRKI